MEQEIPAWVDGRLVAVDKLEVHRRGLFHPAVSVFVLRGPEVLLQRRALGKYHSPGLWANACCTHPRWGEAAAACAARRLREELGLDSVELVARDWIDYRADVGGGMTEHERVALFTAEAPAGLSLDPNPAEVMATRWLTLAELGAAIAASPAAFTPWLRIYLAEHSARIFGAAALSGSDR